MGNGALTLAVTLMAAEAWLVRASPCKSKYAVSFISVALENKVQLKVYKNFDDEEEREMAGSSVLLYIPWHQVWWTDERIRLRKNPSLIQNY